MSLVPYIQFGERVVGENSPLYTDVANRPLKYVMLQSGLDDTQDFYGFASGSVGDGSPEGIVTSRIGSIYGDRTGATGPLWAKTTGVGNIGWKIVLVGLGTAGIIPKFSATGLVDSIVSEAAGVISVAGSLVLTGSLTGVTTITTSGAINGQTISATASFTGTVAAVTHFTAPLLIGTTRVTSPLIGTTTAVNLVFDRNSVMQLTLASLSATFAGVLIVTGASVTIGTTPATTGAIRLGSQQSISWRNIANSGDIAGIVLNASDQLDLTGAANGVRILPGGALYATFASNQVLLADSVGITMGNTNFITFGSTLVATTGNLRFRHNNTLMISRNNANNANFTFLQYGSAGLVDTLHLTGAAGVTVGINATTSYWLVNASNHLVPSTATSDIGLTGSPVRRGYFTNVSLRAVDYIWPAADAAGLLTSDGIGNLSWGGVAPSILSGFGADGGYLRSNGSAWVRVQGVAAADITAGTFTGAFTFSSTLGITGNTIIGTTVAATGSPRLDVLASLALVIGDVSTDATIKVGRFASRHYTNAEESVSFAAITSGSTTNTLSLGGGSTVNNAVTTIAFYTAADNVTLTGTLRGSITSAGVFAWNAGVTVATTLNVSSGVRFGTSSAASIDIGIWVSNISSTAVSAYLVRADGAFPATTTTSGWAGYFRLVTTAAAFTMTNGYGVYVPPPTIGAGSTVTTGYGLFADAAVWNGTTGYGIRVGNVTGAVTNYAIFTGTGLVQFGDAVTTTSSLTIAGALSGVTTLAISSDVTYSDALWTLVANTADAADTSRAFLAGGGVASVSRGAYVGVSGNENATTPGNLLLVAGATGYIQTLGNIIPTSNGTDDLGSASFKFRTAYLGTSLIIGTDPTGAQALRVGGLAHILSTTANQLRLAYSTGQYLDVNITSVGALELLLTGTTPNIALFAAGSYGGGKGVIFGANAVTVPTTNPVGGGIVYWEGGALKARGSAGTITTLAPA